MAAFSPADRLRALPALAPHLVRLPGAGRGPAVPTGLPALDRLLGGGFPRGCLSEVVGPRSSGRTSLLLATLARATAGGALAAVVDATDGLDPASARAAGVALGRLLWVRCGGRLDTALRALDVVVRGGGFEVVALDLGDLPPGVLARVPAPAFVRLQRAAEATPAALLLTGPRTVAGSLAALVVALRPGPRAWAPGGPALLLGLAGEAWLLRARSRAPGGGVPLAWGLEAPAGPAAARPRGARPARRADGVRGR
jgi:hypothetical protein